MIRFLDDITGYAIDVQQYQWGFREGTEYRQRVWGETGAGVLWRERIPFVNQWLSSVTFAGDRALAEQIRTLTYLVMDHGGRVKFFPDVANAPATFRWVDWPETLDNVYVSDWRHEITLDLRESLGKPPADASMLTVLGEHVGVLDVPQASVTAPDLTVMLLIGAETGIVDESRYARTLTAIGNAARTTAQAKYGAASLTFDGTGDYISAPDSPDWDFRTGGFTVEGWFRFQTKTTAQGMLGQWSSVASGSNWFVGLASNGTGLFFSGMPFGGGTVRSVTGAFVPTLGQWYHLAADRSGSTVRVYVNGAVVAIDAAFSIDINPGAAVLTLGAMTATNTFPVYDYNGQMDEIRITKGLARYAGAFTPPTAPFPRP